MKKIPQDMHVGAVYETFKCGVVEVVHYQDANNVFIEFLSTGFVSKSRSQKIRNGQLKDPFSPNVCGIGFFGVGSFKAFDGSRPTPAYDTWNSMMWRCYSEKYHSSHTYTECTVCDEWHNFQVFAEWFEKNHDYGLELDKDIRIKGNKIYSPSSCLFIPSQLNSMLNNSAKSRGLFPIGVTIDKRSGKFNSSITVECKSVHIGTFNTPEEAGEAYRKVKRKKIERVISKNKYRHLSKYLYQHL